MKKLILFAVVSTLASYAAISSAHVEKIIAEVSSVDQNIKAVQLTDSGLVKVIKYDNTLLTQQLADGNRDEMLNAADQLSMADIESQGSLAVCHIFVPSFLLQNLYVGDTTSSNLNLVLSANSCSLISRRMPSNPALLQTAELLKTQLLVLAHQIAG